MKSLSRQYGFSLIEMLVYVAILATVFILVVNTILVVTGSYSSIKSSNDLNNSALVSLERLVRETRQANSIDLVQSVFGAHPGRLVLNTTDKNNDPLVIDFYIENNQLKIKKNGVLSGALVRDNVIVDNLVFRNLSTTTSSSVKIEMTLSVSEGKVNKTEKFYSSVVLRGSY
jgi:prepilin-type N-terminal cleavage/methylation domain-containing protein